MNLTINRGVIIMKIQKLTESVFEKLKDVPDEYLDKFTEIMNCATELTSKNKDPEKPQKLIKIE